MLGVCEVFLLGTRGGSAQLKEREELLGADDGHAVLIEEAARANDPDPPPRPCIYYRLRRPSLLQPGGSAPAAPTASPPAAAAAEQPASGGLSLRVSTLLADGTEECSQTEQPAFTGSSQRGHTLLKGRFKGRARHGGHLRSQLRPGFT